MWKICERRPRPPPAFGSVGVCAINAPDSPQRKVNNGKLRNRRLRERRSAGRDVTRDEVILLGINDSTAAPVPEPPPGANSRFSTWRCAHFAHLGPACAVIAQRTGRRVYAKPGPNPRPIERAYGRTGASSALIGHSFDGTCCSFMIAESFATMSGCWAATLVVSAGSFFKS